MAFSRRLGVVCILGVSWLVAVGCSDDSDKKRLKVPTAVKAAKRPAASRPAAVAPTTPARVALRLRAPLAKAARRRAARPVLALAACRAAPECQTRRARRARR